MKEMSPLGILTSDSSCFDISQKGVMRQIRLIITGFCIAAIQFLCLYRFLFPKIPLIFAFLSTNLFSGPLSLSSM